MPLIDVVEELGLGARVVDEETPDWVSLLLNTVHAITVTGVGVIETVDECVEVAFT